MANTNIKIVGMGALVLALGFVFYGLFPESGLYTAENETSSSDIGTVIAVLPSGFPEEMPVRVNGIKDSFSSFYQDSGISTYLVSYVTNENRSVLYEEYMEYLRVNQFEIIEEEEDPLYMHANNGDAEVEIILNEKEGEVLVTIHYTPI